MEKCKVNESHFVDDHGCLDCFHEHLTNEVLMEMDREEELYKILAEIADKNLEIIEHQKERAIGPLMSIAMKEIRGKADGDEVNRILLNVIRNRIK